ncbi:NAD(P)-binding Rossmann-fold superfamily protein [Striga asiatica]|uniref:NAD(P)-binding Rossmann-fold superfamily protein n=1 Tax=Striga asiatica TaxID=4170 RepID=A0A5A7REG2_STRAF|nr:NAD(P)-binding Rossmann-fold superfamily protein [Striga asiatica]
MRPDLKIRTSVNSAACSPSAKASPHALDQAIPCSTNEPSYFKENININKSESPKLSMEPLQMKRKKKGGGYNLRKSLAWDKAFFTEEGVLDPVELSVISGTSCRERSPFINGGTHGSPQIPKKLEKDLLKEMQDEQSGRDGSRGWSSPKIDSASSKKLMLPSASRKLTTYLGKKSGSRCGDCPRPLPSSSYPLFILQSESILTFSYVLRKPAIVNAGKTAGKDLKLLKFPGMKPSLSPICVSNMSTILKANPVKHNQIAKPDFDSHRNPGSKSFARSFQDTQSASKSSSQRPPRYSDGNSGNSSFKRLSSDIRSPVLADNSGSRMISDITTPVRSVNSSEDRKESTSSASLISQHAHVYGATMHTLPNPPTKPSGLRMPSPSLSFFSQPIRPVFHDSSFRDKETDKPENARFQDNLTRKPKVDSDIQARMSGNGRSSISDRIASSQVNTVEVIKPKIEQKHVKKIPHNCRYGNGNIANEEIELQKVDTELPTESASHKQVVDDKLFSGHPSVSQPSSRYSGSTSVSSSDHSRVAEKSYFGSMHLHDDRTKETALPKLPTNVLMRKIHMENALCALSVGGYRSDINSEVDNCTNQSGEGLASPPRNAVFNTSNRLLLDKQLCVQSSLQEENVEKLKLVVADRQNLNKDTKITTRSSPSPVNMCNHNFDEEKISRHLVSTKLNFVSNSSLSEINSSLVDASSNNADALSDNPADRNLSNSLHEDSHKLKIDNCSSFHESRTGEQSQEKALGKMTETGAILQDDSADNQLTSNMTSRGRESGMDNVRHSQDPESVLVLSSEISEFCTKESKRLTLPRAKFVAENIGHHNHRLHVESCFPVEYQADVSTVKNAIGSTECTDTGETESCSSTSTSTSFSSKDTPLVRDEKCSDAYGVKDYTADVIPDLSRVEPFPDTSRSKDFEDTNDSLSSFHPKLDHVKVEAALSPYNIHGDDLTEKRCLSALPQNAIPFSEEWLAAIEAAGEDILSKKSGAVQNSPPDKSLPEPSPWSPVKRKNNQMGPFDCTKFTNIVSSNSQ